MIVWLLAAQVVSASPDATLPVPLRYAAVWEVVRARNPEIAAARASARAAEAMRPAAAAPSNPMLGLGVADAPVSGRMAAGEFELAQTLPLPWKISARSGEARAMAEEAAANARSVERRIAVETRAAVAEYGFAHRALQALERDVESARDVAASVRARYAAGAGEVPQLLRAEQEALLAESDRLDHERRRAVARARLNLLMNRELRATIPDPAADGPVPPSEADAEALVSRAMSQSPDVQMAEAALARARARRRLAASEWIPDLALRAAWMPMLRGAGPDRWRAGVGIELPLFGWARQAAESAAAREAESAARSTLEAGRAHVRFRVVEALAMAHEAERHVRLRRDSLIPLAARSLAAVRASYAGGDSDFAMLLEAVRTLRMQHLDAARDAADLERAVGELEEAVGAPLAAEEERR